MPFNPFSGSDGPSFESPDGFSQKVQQTNKTVSDAAKQQSQAAKQSFVDQLYGNTSQMGEESDPQETGSSQTNLVQQAQKAQQNAGGEVSSTQRTPEETAKIEQLRQKLHSENYFDYKEQTVSDSAVLKISHQNEQAWQERQQQEQEEAQQKEEEKAAQEESMGAGEPAGKNAKAKGNGRNRMSQPIALRNAKTRTEINRGTSG